MAYTMEEVMQIWDDKSGERYEVGLDRDGLGLVEIRSYTAGGMIDSRMVFSIEAALLIAKAIAEMWNTDNSKSQ